MDGPTRLEHAVNGNGTGTGNGDLRQNGGPRSRQNSGGRLNGSGGSDDQINEHFYDVPEVSFGFALTDFVTFPHYP